LDKRVGGERKEREVNGRGRGGEGKVRKEK
jgi:hypothetical protein